MSDSLRLQTGLHHTRILCPSLSLKVWSNSHPLTWWCCLTVSSSVIPFPPALNLSQHQGLFQWVRSSVRWPKYWSFSFSISHSSEYSELISFRMDWLNSLEVQGTLKSLLQHHSSKASILWCSAFFIVQLSYPYMTLEKLYFHWTGLCCQSNVCFLICCLGWS